MGNTEKDRLWDLDSEWREINFLFHYLHQKHFFKPLLRNSPPPFMPHEKQIALNEFVLKVCPTLTSIDAAELKINIHIDKNTQEFKNHLLECFNENTINIDNFDWIEPKNIYLVEYLWGYLNTTIEERNEKFPILRPFYKLTQKTPQRGDTKLYNGHKYKDSLAKKTNLNVAVDKSTDKLREVISGFDALHCSVHIKKQLIEQLKNKWHHLKNNNDFKMWIDKNEELTDWALEYVKKRFLENRLPFWLPSLNEENERKRREKIKLTLSTIYNLIEPEENKLLMMTLLSKAGAQQKYRIKHKKNKKTIINIIISNSDKDIFDKSKKNRNLNSEEMLSELINFYFESTNKERQFKIFS